MSAEFFADVKDRIGFGGLDSEDDLSFKVYDPNRMVLGKRMEDHLRIAVCYWHSFNWPGSDVFGAGTFDRPWLQATGDPMAAAHQKMDAAFEFFSKLGYPVLLLPRRRHRPRGRHLRRVGQESRSDGRLRREEDGRDRRQVSCGERPTCSPILAMPPAPRPTPTRPYSPTAPPRSSTPWRRPIAWAVPTTCLWGGREGYETLLNTDLKSEGDQLARFLTMVAEHKHKIGFEGTLLIEPKPAEPTKHQYDYDCQSVHGFLELLRPGRRVPRQHRRQPRHPGRAQLPS